MTQSHQDDTYNDLATFAETSYIFLTLLSLQRRLNYDELYLLERATKAAAKLQRVQYGKWIPLAGNHTGSGRQACQ
jgi:hypothetical protein